MTEEAKRLKSDLKHTMSARARAESREDEVQKSLTMVEGELREVRGELRVAYNPWLRPGMGCSLASMSFIRLGMSSLHPEVSCGNLKRSFVRPMTICVIR